MLKWDFNAARKEKLTPPYPQLGGEGGDQPLATLTDVFSAQEHSRFRHPAIPKTYICPPSTFYKIQLDSL